MHLEGFIWRKGGFASPLKVLEAQIYLLIQIYPSFSGTILTKFSTPFVMTASLQCIICNLLIVSMGPVVKGKGSRTWQNNSYMQWLMLNFSMYRYVEVMLIMHSICYRPSTYKCFHYPSPDWGNESGSGVYFFLHVGKHVWLVVDKYYNCDATTTQGK